MYYNVFIFAKTIYKTMKEKRTAMEELIFWVESNYTPIDYLKKAKELLKLEKEQIIDAFWHGDNSDCTSEQNSKQFAEEYYNETYLGGQPKNKKIFIHGIYTPRENHHHTWIMDVNRIQYFIDPKNWLLLKDKIKIDDWITLNVYTNSEGMNIAEYCKID